MEAEKERILQLIQVISQSPGIGYFMNKAPNGMIGASKISSHLSELSVRLLNTGTKEQWDKLGALCDAYKQVVQDLNESYLLYIMYCDMKKKFHDKAVENDLLKAQIEYLKKENEKLVKTINADSEL